MKVLDENNNEIQNPDLEKGYLTNETIVIAHHEAVKAKPGKSHIEVIKEYENGGKDVVTVWDEEPTEAKEAYDETEEIQRYHPYSEEELEDIEKMKLKTKDEQNKLNALYNSDMTFTDIVDSVANLIYGGSE